MPMLHGYSIDVHRVSGIATFDRDHNTCVEIGTTGR